MAQPEMLPIRCATPWLQAAPAKIVAPLPQAALARLPQLHAESRLALRRSRLLVRAVPAAGLLLAMAVPAALAGGAPMASAFAWSLLVLLGIGAVLRNHLGASARQAGAASDLRVIFLYMGAAWGAGAFLALAPPAAALPWVLAAFAALPTLTLVLLLGDIPAILAFAAPVTLMTSSAAALQGGPATAAPLLLVQGALALLVLRNRPRWGNVPAGLALH